MTTRRKITAKKPTRRQAANRQERKKRTPFGVMRQKLNLDPDTQAWLKSEGKVPRWINDKDNRLQDALAGDYEFVMSNRTPVKTGDAKEAQEENRKIRKYAGKRSDGSPMYTYLMAIKEDFHAEDQQAKEEINKQVDEAIRGGKPPGLDHHGVDSQQGSTNAKKIDYSP